MSIKQLLLQRMEVFSTLFTINNCILDVFVESLLLILFISHLHFLENIRDFGRRHDCARQKLCLFVC